MKIYRFIRYIINREDKPEGKKRTYNDLYDVDWQLKVDEEDIRQLLDIISSYFSCLSDSRYTSLKLFFFYYGDLSHWCYVINKLEFRDNLKPHVWIVKSEDRECLYFFRDSISASRYTKNHTAQTKVKLLYRKPFYYDQKPSINKSTKEKGR